MKLIPIITSYAGDHVEEYVNLDHICSIAPDFYYDEFDVLCKSDSLTVLSLVNGSNIIILSSYDDFIMRLENIAKKSCNMNVMEED